MKRLRLIMVFFLALAMFLVPISGLPQCAFAQQGAAKNIQALFTSAARTTSTSSAFDIGNANALVVYEKVTAQSGTNPTLDIVVQDSVDNTDWFNLITFTQVTAATGSEVLVPSRAPGRYIRAVATVGGSATPTFTFSLKFSAFRTDGITVSTALSGILSGTSYTLTGGNGETTGIRSVSELVTLSTGGVTTDTSANLLPANSLILGVVARVTTTITTATDWKLGDANVAGRFTGPNSTLTAGTTDISSVQWLANTTSVNAGPIQVAAAKLRITTTGTPGAGAIRVTVFYIPLTAPTS